MIETLKDLDNVRLNFTEGGLFAVNITLAFIMFGVALDIKIKNFKDVFTINKRAPLTGFISQFFLLPFVTFLVTVLLKNVITPSIALGMILVAACPGGNISNFISALAKGNAALSVTLTAIASISAIFLTPFNFSFWGSLYLKIASLGSHETLLRPLEINPVAMFQTVFVLLGLPLTLGMLFNHYFPRITSKILKPVKIVSIFVFFGIVILALRNNFEHFVSNIEIIFLIVLIHNAIAFFSGFYFASVLKNNKKDRRTISIETGIQNSGLALVLLFNPKIFPLDLANGGMMFIAAWWGVWHIISGLGIAWFWNLKAFNKSEA